MKKSKNRRDQNRRTKRFSLAKTIIKRFFNKPKKRK